MKNFDAYKTEGFEEWLKDYDLRLDGNLRNDLFVLGGNYVSQLAEYDVKAMKKEGMSDNDVIDYIRLHQGWLVGIYEGAFLGATSPLLFDEEFRLLDNPTHVENLKALRFVVFMDQQYHKKKYINLRKEARNR